MKKNVAALLKEPGAGETLDFVVEDFPREGEYRILDLPEVHGELVNAGNHLTFSARVSARIEGICVRCLDPVVYPMQFEFEDSFAMETTMEALSGDLDASDVYPLRDEWLDLTQCVWEHFMLAIPMQLLCRPDCPGLCPHCGADLKQGPCGCAAGLTDPRLAVLARLKQD
jgi:uncharacterized protein